jgi:PKHD-type hydroxylase
MVMITVIPMAVRYNFHALPKTHLTVGGFFTPADLERVTALVATLPVQDAMVAGAGYRHLEPKSRVSKTAFLNVGEHEWVFRAMQTVIVNMNAKHFGFGLTAIETVQYVEYPVGGHFAAHMDLIPGSFMRKLAVSVQLSAATDYDGGDLACHLSHQNTAIASRVLGDAFMFPTYMMHHVTPVTRGTRKALLAWASGPAFQ